MCESSGTSSERATVGTGMSDGGAAEVFDMMDLGKRSGKQAVVM